MSRERQPLVCRSLGDAEETVAGFEAQLSEIERKRKLVFAALEQLYDLSQSGAQGVEPDIWVELVRRCDEMIRLSLRLVRRTEKEKTFAESLLANVPSAAAQGRKDLYTIRLMQSLLYNKASAHGEIRFDLLLPYFQKTVLTALEDTIPPLFATETDLSREVEFYRDLFELMLGPAARRWAAQRDYMMEHLVPKYATLYYLRTRAPLRLLRNAHNQLVDERLHRGAGDTCSFPPGKGKRKHRVGFFGGGNSHGHGWPCLKPVIARLDRAGIEPVFLTYSDDPGFPDMEIEQFTVENWETAAADIRALRLDMLFFSTPFDRDLSAKFMLLGHCRLAPLQVTAFYNNTTTSLPDMDVVITSASMDDPAALDRLFSEQEVILMRNLPFAFDPQGYFPDTYEHLAKADLSVPENAKIITCGNSLWVKANLEFFEFIASLMVRDENLYFVVMPVTGAHGGLVFFHLRQVFDAAGIDRARVVLVEPASRERHYGILALADLYIDFFPFSGANSLFDALWTRTPLLTHSGEHLMRFRQGRAILEDIGLGEMVARDEEDMRQKALAILAGGGEALRRKMGPEKVLSCSAFDGRSAQELADILTMLAKRAAADASRKESASA